MRRDDGACGGGIFGGGTAGVYIGARGTVITAGGDGDGDGEAKVGDVLPGNGVL